ncbi:hypothetical protein BBI01_02855 [Chryseobacterium artocarpi]|uniref:Uncharacterized protein n=1 Tax=Chryseobacterium artocarpi TaxID=1414727 RepID=A0A1B9A0N6_9FLAO|nr:hypothetical protein BBI01_02855 [Chryseobacterium artocarpi]
MFALAACNLKKRGTNSRIIKNIIFEFTNDEVIVKAVDSTFYDITTEYPRYNFHFKKSFKL